MIKDKFNSIKNLFLLKIYKTNETNFKYSNVAFPNKCL